MVRCGPCQGGSSKTWLGSTRLKAVGLVGLATSLLGANGIVSMPSPSFSLCLAAGGGGWCEGGRIEGARRHHSL